MTRLKPLLGFTGTLIGGKFLHGYLEFILVPSLSGVL